MSWLAALSFARAHWLALLAALVAIAALAGSYQLGCRYEKQDWQVKWSNRDAADAIAKAQAAKDLEAAELAARISAHESQVKVDQARTELENAKQINADLAATIDRQRTQLGSLRSDLSRAAAGPATGDTLATCRSEAGQYAALLATGAEIGERLRDLAAASSRAHDDRAAEVEKLLQSWPHRDQ